MHKGRVDDTYTHTHTHTHMHTHTQTHNTIMEPPIEEHTPSPCLPGHRYPSKLVRNTTASGMNLLERVTYWVQRNMMKGWRTVWVCTSISVSTMMTPLHTSSIVLTQHCQVQSMKLTPSTCQRTGDYLPQERSHDKHGGCGHRVSVVRGGEECSDDLEGEQLQND